MMMNIEKQSCKLVKPFVKTPPTLRDYRIGLVDELMPFINIGVVLYFSPNNNHDIESILARLEKSLEKTLTRFYPLAGRFDNKIFTIDCNDQGAEFIHAKVNMKLQDILIPNVNLKFVDDFIPSNKFAIDQYREPLLSVQVTMFECGGVALGVNASHKIVDASTLSTFIIEWAAMNRKENEIESTGPSFNSSTLFPGRCFGTLSVQLIMEDMSSKYMRMILSFNESAISKLKAAMAHGNICTKYYSKVQLLSSILWKAFMDVDRATNNIPKNYILLQAVSLRGKMASLIPKNSCGNILAFCATEAGNAETSKELADLLTNNVKRTINSFSNVCHDSEDGQTTVINSITLKDVNIQESTHVLTVTSWSKFPFYEADFGFGKPTWAAPGSFAIQNSACLMDDAQGNGVDAHFLVEVENIAYFERALEIISFAD